MSVNTNIPAYDELLNRYPAKSLPIHPFIGLFGNHHNNWRKWAIRLLSIMGVSESQIYDSTDPGWQIVSEHSGDDLQDWINELVCRQHLAMRHATCIIFSMDSMTRSWPEDLLDRTDAIPKPIDKRVGTIFAARCELGWLSGIGKQTFVWIPDDLEGRNYLRAVVRMYPAISPVANLYEACARGACTLGVTGSPQVSMPV